jgi:heptosyltransferase-2
MTSSLNRALIIRFSSVGDIVLSSLLVRALRSRFPSSQIDFVVKEEFADLVRYNPYISSVIAFPRNGRFADLRHLRSRIARTAYDAIFDIHDSLRSRYLCAGAANVHRVNKRKLARFLLVKFKINAYARFGGAPSVALRYLETARSFGVADDGNGLDLFFDRKDAMNVEAVIGPDFPPDERFIGVCPSAKHANKMWPAERFAEVGRDLSTTYRRPILLFGSDRERTRCEEIAARMGRVSPDLRVLNLAGRLSLSETAAAMDRCAVVVTNDSGLMHIAAARKRPVVAIFGPTVRELGFFPWGTRSIVLEREGLACRPCTSIGLPECPKKHFKCMNEITARHVLDAVGTLLSQEHG